ncbi:tRNA-dihydrouridine synthase family protein [uncultured Clostridium sp.]|uniref:tRNA dihydrouridine synthase n=1 Tax=uncultured Clostridium sp. TaxID=59620 RepID=UPI0028E47E5C|nr:tRNA-dihydrouridine synthase family protein [uncultured Clostridium sp.]
MKFYYAPMEGITGHIYRNVHNDLFKNDIDKYFSPFVVANQSKSLKTKELIDILPENNQGIALVPQILTNNGKDFINTAKKMKYLGYDEINLNLGCPSGTVVSKNRGSGFLSKIKELDDFLEEIFSEAVTKISIKTRLGKDSPEEFYELIKIFNKYPMEELIIHPRTQKDFYGNEPNLKVFKDALSLSKNTVCYNGDIFTVEAYEKFTKNFKSVQRIMLGRGLLANPELVRNIINETKLNKETLKEFHDGIYEAYKKNLSGDIYVLHKMKELWFYMLKMFHDAESYAKKIRMCDNFSDYEEAVLCLFREREFI